MCVEISQLALNASKGLTSITFRINLLPLKMQVSKKLLSFLSNISGHCLHATNLRSTSVISLYSPPMNNRLVSIFYPSVIKK